ncbi:MAG: Stk1 family PASTA domain-containing Ser/Thr kinase [Coriobacteriaceae bacterium]|jgi:serine/threonine-protein kinase|nr:Stk1 family PASTA domain-containing Ser/Thr kinase [Coriobacteriaceae bacterium]
MIGRIFNNRYTLLDRIGIGGMAEVYRAQDTVLGRIVAVKTMLPQYAADSTFTQRFRQEAAAAANLQSPYIVNVYDWGQDDGTYYIVMEYIRGSDLKTAIKERGAINQRKVAEIGAQVCQALTAAHNLDIMHRDIKPQNIMVQPDGNVKVMDFGIARAKNSVMTQTSSVLGTAHYISPEQAQGKELTPASDIYSLGIVLYEAATGHLPFDGPDAVSVALKQVNELPARPSTLNPDIDADFEGIIMKSLMKRPIDRFATANDMRLALNDYLAGRPVVLEGSFAHAETAVLGGMGGKAAGGRGPDALVPNGTAVMPSLAHAGGMQGGKQVGMQGASPITYRVGNDRQQGVNKKTIAIIIGTILALVAAGVITFLLMSNMGADNKASVPDLVGQTVDVAAKKLEDNDFVLGRQDTTFSDTVEAGKIISQDPKANTKAEKGTKVNIVVSSGREEVTIPDLTNKTADEAKQLLEKAGLKGSAGTAEYSSTVEVNRIIRQEPGANTKAHKGDTVTYILSLGTESTEVPNVVGKTRNEAIVLLENAEFKVNEASEYDDTVEEGRVISQNPNAAIKAEKGSTVTIVVSKGKEPEPDPVVPNVVGMKVTDARVELQAAGFAVDVTGSTDANATVESQSIAGGSTAKKGSTIQIVAKAPVTTPPPGGGSTGGTGGTGTTGP